MKSIDNILDSFLSKIISVFNVKEDTVKHEIIKMLIKDFVKLLCVSLSILVLVLTYNRFSTHVEFFSKSILSKENIH